MSTENPAFTFIDLFAGIGGMRLAFEAAGGECRFSSEWDAYSQKTYEANFNERPAGDITKIRSEDIPDHDVLVGGFPCQPFSISGVSKKKSLGRPHGFDDPTQGTLFFEVKRIIGDKRPRAFLLENVKNLKSHDRGRTFRTIMESLEGEQKLGNLGYFVETRILDAASYVPQHRERIFFAGFRTEEDRRRFHFPEPPAVGEKAIRDILEPNADPRYTLTDRLWEYLRSYADKHRAKGNGFGYGLADLDGISRTLSARYYKDGSEILIPQEGKNPRRLTPLECARLMGFTEVRPDFKIPVSDTRAYKQFGNAVAVPLVTAIARSMAMVLRGESAPGLPNSTEEGPIWRPSRPLSLAMKAKTDSGPTLTTAASAVGLAADLPK